MRQRSIVFVGLGAIAAIAALRAVVLAAPGVPSGIDGGNWLAFSSIQRPGVVYPPLVPTVLTILSKGVGPTAACALLGAVASAAPGLVILAVATWQRRAVIGVFAALAATGSGALGETAAWGGYPQPLGLAAVLAALGAAVAYLDGGGRRELVVFGLLFAAAVWTSHLESIPALGALTLLVLWHVTSHRGTHGGRAAALLGVACLGFAALAPVYAALLATIGVASPQPLDPARILGVGWVAYLALLCLVPPSLALAHVRARRGAPISQRDLSVAGAAAAAIVAWAGAFLVSGEPRLIHDAVVLAPFGALGVTPFWTLGRPWSIALRSAGVAATGAVVATGLAVFPAQASYYRILNASEVAAVQWLATPDQQGAERILVADVRGVPLGWWVEGLAGREVLFASDTRWLRFEAERTQARIANTILYGSGFPGEASIERASTAGVRYVLLASGAAFGISRESPPPGWGIAFAAGDTVVLALTSADTARAQR